LRKIGFGGVLTGVDTMTVVVAAGFFLLVVVDVISVGE